jgi:hypothetical protein
MERFGQWGVGVRQFGGAIDEFLLFSRILDPSEISELYAEGRPD